jgi:hypothetical protein
LADLDALLHLDLMWADHVLSVGINCNVSLGTGVCGGAGAVVFNSMEIDLVEITAPVVGPIAVLTSMGSCSHYHCVGSVIQDPLACSGWSCAPGPFLVLPSPVPAPPPSSTPGDDDSHPSTPLGAIIGGTISGFVVFALVAALLLH